MAALPARVRSWSWAAWVLMFLEQTGRSLVPAVAVVAAFVILALFDVFSILPLWLHWSLLALFGLALFGALWFGFRTWRAPGRGDALRRLEADSGLVHRPLTHLTDRQASNLVDPWATVLWAHYQKKLLAGLGQLTLNPPKSEIARKDPFALRGLAVLLLALGIGIAWGQSADRLWASVAPQPRGTPDLTGITVEAWITPPDYTRLAPIALKADSAAPQPAAADESPIEVPVGSKLLVQIQGLSAAANLNANNASKPMEMLDSDTQRAELVLKEGERIGIAGGGLNVGWPIALRPDLPPTAALQEPTATERGVLHVVYGGKDDFGVSEMRLSITQGNETVDLPLTIQGADPREVKGASYQDLTAHPWAGLQVELRAVARDALGQIGASAPVAMTLPERKFYHPVARAIIEQRKHLAKDGNAASLQVARRLAQLMTQPDAFDNNIATFLGLDFTVKRLTSNPLDKEELANVLQLMWDTALALEDGGVSMAMRELRRLQHELEDALARGASDEEIERLMNELQQAMNEYLRQMQQQLAEAMQKGMQMQQLDPNSLQLSQQDLNEMLNQARRMAQNGARESAQQMLQQLQNMLENLQMAMPMPGQGNGQAQRMLNDLGKIMQQQQQLLQDTFRRQRGQQPGDQSGEGQQGTGEGQGQMQGGGNGAAAQEALRQQLGELMRRFSNATGEIPQGLGQAEQFMRGATDALRGEELDSAAQAQNDALEQLQQGMQQMNQMMRQQMGAQRGPGQRDPMDPFGRALSDDEGPGGDAFAREGSDVVPLNQQLDRSRQIFEELRQRRNETGRPKYERDYLDRLLRQF
ncbi:MAG: TIGR02302 family protein [Dongiaceae bacterium]